MPWHPIKNKLSHLVQWFISLHPERTAERGCYNCTSPLRQKKNKKRFQAPKAISC